MDTWEEKEARIIARDLHTCYVCGAKENLHANAFWRSAKGALVNEDDAHFVTLCESCMREVAEIRAKYIELEIEYMTRRNSVLRPFLLDLIYRRDTAYGGNVDLAGRKNRGTMEHINKLKQCIYIYEPDYRLFCRKKQRLMEDIPEDGIQNDFQDMRREHLYNEWNKTHDVEHMKKLGASNSFIDDLILGKKRQVCDK